MARRPGSSRAAPDKGKPAVRRRRKARGLERRDGPAAEGAQMSFPSRAPAVTPDPVAPRCRSSSPRSLPPVPSRDPAAAGRVHFMRSADSTFDAFTRSPRRRSRPGCARTTGACGPTRRTSTRASPGRRRPGCTRTPTRSTSAAAVARDHPDWILRDAAGNKLYIPFGLQERHLPAVRRRHRQPGVPDVVDLAGPRAARARLQRHLRRRRQPLPQGRQRRRAAGRPDRPAHRTAC